MIIHSIKWRLQAWHGFLLVCLVAGLMTGFYIFERRERLQAIDKELLEAMTPLLPRVLPPQGRSFPERGPLEGGRRPPPREGDGPPPPNRPPNERLPDERVRDARPFDSERFYYAVWTESGERLPGSTNAPAFIPRPQFGGQKPGHLLRTRGTSRELAQRNPTGRCVLVGTSLAAMQTQLEQLAVALVAIGSGIVVVGLAVGWWLATRALRPLAEISRTAHEITAGDLSRRINASETESELGQLAAVLNSTFARLETAFAQQQQFTSDAAHELRTPVSVILTQVQSTLNRERTPAEYRETLEACQRAAQRMRRLIESLLELARFDAGQQPLPRMPFDLAAVAQGCVELIEPLARERRAKLALELAAAPGQGDAERIGQVITNLLANAVNYTPAGGEVRLTTRRDADAVVLTVADTGPGISPEHLPRIFDRFYRADAARTSAQGRSGLGLAISKAIVEAHWGSITAVSPPGGGAEFTVRLPAAIPKGG